MSVTLAAFVLYLLVVWGIGLFSARQHTQTSEGFSPGNRSMNSWVVALSAVASGCSAWLLLGMRKRMTLWGAVAGILTGAMVTWLWKVSLWLQKSVIKDELVPGFLLTMLAIIGVSLLTQPLEKERVERQFEAMKAPPTRPE